MENEGESDERKKGGKVREDNVQQFEPDQNVSQSLFFNTEAKSERQMLLVTFRNILNLSIESSYNCNKVANTCDPYQERNYRVT